MISERLATRVGEGSDGPGVERSVVPVRVEWRADEGVMLVSAPGWARSWADLPADLGFVENMQDVVDVSRALREDTLQLGAVESRFGRPAFCYLKWGEGFVVLSVPWASSVLGRHSVYRAPVPEPAPGPASEPASGSPCADRL